jgi:hypothetical protein
VRLAVLFSTLFRRDSRPDTFEDNVSKGEVTDVAGWLLPPEQPVIERSNTKDRTIAITYLFTKYLLHIYLCEGR